MSASASHRLRRLREAGVSIWLDTLSRDLLESGRFAELVRDYGVTGATSNPTIFAKAITNSQLYDAQIAELAAAGIRDPREVFFGLALDDVRAAARALRGVYDATRRDGFVSFECTPDLADDADATVAQALGLWRRLAEPNVMIKVPATEAGLVAIEELTRLGVNVNVTLLFAVERYEQVIEAYLRGLAARAGEGRSVAGIASVASFFVSRIDSKVDPLLPPASLLRGRVAVANARLAYRSFETAFSGPAWEAFKELGAHPQRPLWASTGTKDQLYSDVLYVSELIGPDVINTMPEATLLAFADHGIVARTVDAEAGQPVEVLGAAARARVDMQQITAELERDGVRAFCASYDELLRCIDEKLQALPVDAAADAHLYR
jgi:transaldolase